MSIIVRDTFTGSGLLSAHTGDIGATWSVQPGSSGWDCTLGTGRAHQTPTSGAFGQLIASGIPPSADYVVRCTITRLTNLGDENIQIQGRSSSTANTSYALVWRDASSVWQLQRVVGGVFTQIGPDTSSPAVTNGVALNIRMYFRGHMIKAYVDATNVFDLEDGAITDAGFAGVGGFAGTSVGQSDTTGWQFDDFEAEALSYLRPGNTLRPRIFAPGLAR